MRLRAERPGVDVVEMELALINGITRKPGNLFKKIQTTQTCWLQP
jgi:hypothetical protein